MRLRPQNELWLCSERSIRDRPTQVWRFDTRSGLKTLDCGGFRRSLGCSESLLVQLGEHLLRSLLEPRALEEVRVHPGVELKSD